MALEGSAGSSGEENVQGREGVGSEPEEEKRKDLANIHNRSYTLSFGLFLSKGAISQALFQRIAC